ncbi:ATP synthase subunit I [Rubeoparvulum massiliense]|uniref:ATP synthase subunit I n=1 Tax=Rubeoparvulum massiliense TaxID=1631346 RepID=UPI00065E3C85|nr:ATP synthase subunit I [Rubeoparvulum massiliense]
MQEQTRNDLQRLTARILRISLFFLILALPFFLIASWRIYVAGFMLGTIVSTYNMILTARRTIQITETILSGSKRLRTSGMLIRFATIALGVMLVVRFPETFDLIAFVIGLLLTHIIMVVDGLFHLQ